MPLRARYQQFIRLSLTSAPPGQAAWGAAIGCGLGLLSLSPTDPLPYGLLLVLLLTRASNLLALLFAIPLKLAQSFALTPSVGALGQALLAQAPIAGLVKSLQSIPGVALLGFDRPLAAGGLLLATCLGVTAYLLSRRLLSARVSPASEPGKVDEATPRPAFVRWRATLVTGAALLLAELFLLTPMTALVTRVTARELLDTELALADTSVSLTRAKIDYTGLEARRGQDPLVSLEGAKVDLDVTEALRGRLVIDEALLLRPSLRLAAEKPDPEAQKAWEERPLTVGRRIRRWFSDLALEDAMEEDRLERSLRRLKELLERYEKIAELVEEHKRANSDPLMQPVPGLRGESPSFLLRRLTIEDMRLALADELSSRLPFTLVNARLEVENLSSDPAAVGLPFRLRFSSGLDRSPDAQLSFELEYDPASQSGRLAVALRGVPLAQLDPLLKRSVPLRFRGASRVDFELETAVTAYSIDARPRISLIDIDCEPRDPSRGRIAGLDARKLSSALNKVGRVELLDLRVHGALDGFEVEVGSSLEQLIVTSATRVARAEGDAAVEKTRGKVGKERGRAREKLDGKLGKLGLSGSGVTAPLEKTLGGLLGKGKKGEKSDAERGLDAAEKTLGGALEGLFGGSSKKPKKKKKRE